MYDLLGQLGQLKRPGLLLRAARAGVADYRRDTHLPRLLQRPAPPSSGQALSALMGLEAELNRARRAGDASYALHQHIEVLIAMLGEARQLRASVPYS